MKLNNHGWGFKEMIIYCAILLIFLLIATFMVYQFYSAFKYSDLNSNSSNDDKYDYEALEVKLALSAKNYISDTTEIGEDTIIVNLDNLIEYNYIAKINDLKDGDRCKGYALVSLDGNDLISDGYIKCSNYTSENYQDWRID